ncbi:hypothetical protein IAE39_004185 [Pseudomonas sp. S37]|uniref:hypothetical protein n=1 Tax=Pseudomonas sp. S37 TaxID=2767449 RepID=UPI0019122C92|nr:hypothetical protein [Pseudomonas sp. S37]MBK4996011.1 hypothetical protein [Pseudomonas sp. S37]
MKQKMFLLVAALMSGVAFSNMVAAEEVPTGGTIMFAQKLENGEPGGQQCTLPIKSDNAEHIYNFRTNDASCNNDVHSWFRVENAPSAVIFELRSDAAQLKPGECRPDSQTRWIFKLRTTRQPTTTGWISIPGLRGRPDKTIIDAGGVRLESTRDEGGNIEGKLSCVKINY